jgi:hypothetical protein
MQHFFDLKKADSIRIGDARIIGAAPKKFIFGRAPVKMLRPCKR